jgi:hypothetical protein
MAISPADANEVELAATSQRDRSPVVNVIVAHPGLGEQPLPVKLGCGSVEFARRARRRAASRLMRSLFIVIRHETVDLGL